MFGINVKGHFFANGRLFVNWHVAVVEGARGNGSTFNRFVIVFASRAVHFHVFAFAVSGKR